MCFFVKTGHLKPNIAQFISSELGFFSLGKILISTMCLPHTHAVLYYKYILIFFLINSKNEDASKFFQRCHVVTRSVNLLPGLLCSILFRIFICRIISPPSILVVALSAKWIDLPCYNEFLKHTRTQCF